MENKGRSKIEITLSGAGGQGIVVAGYVIVYAAGILEGREVVQVISYGPEARLGSSRSDVIISDSPIAYPKVKTPDIMLIMNQESYNKLHNNLKEGGVLIVDTTFVEGVQEESAYKVPFTRYAREEIGSPVVANMMALGFMSRLTGIIKIESLKQAIQDKVKKSFVTLNLQAVEKGVHLAEDFINNQA